MGGGRIFESLVNLETLNLSANNVRQIGNADLASLASSSQLRALDLSNNRIASISNFAFAKLYSLKVSYSRRSSVFRHVPRFGCPLNCRKLMSFLTWSLQTLSLRRNRLTSIPPRAFHGLGSLTLLDLGENRLGKIPVRSFHFVRSLRRLFLDRNGFKAIPKMAFYPLSELIELYLHANRRLAVLKENAFDGLFKLEKCILSETPRLSHIRDGAFPTSGKANISSWL